MWTNYAFQRCSFPPSFYFNLRSSTSNSGDKSFFAPPPAGSQRYFFNSLRYPLRGQQISPLQNQYTGHFFTPQSGSPSPREINKMKEISLHTAARLHNPYFPQGHAASIDHTCCKALWGVVNESVPRCGEGTVWWVCVLFWSPHLEPDLVNKHSDRNCVPLHNWCSPPMWVGKAMWFCFLLEL